MSDNNIITNNLTKRYGNKNAAVCLLSYTAMKKLDIKNSAEKSILKIR